MKVSMLESSKPRFKARLVAKGFNQREGIDFNKIYSPVVKHSSIRVLLALIAQCDMKLEQIDVKTAFLHGNRGERILMAQPERFVKKRDEDKAYLLKKSLYGLKQSPRQWYLRFDEYKMRNNYSRSSYDSCIDEKLGIFLLLSVDDMLIASTNMTEIQKLCIYGTMRLVCAYTVRSCIYSMSRCAHTLMTYCA